MGTSLYTRERRSGRYRLAEFTLVLNPLLLVCLDNDDRLLPHGVVGILVHHLKDVCGASVRTIPTPIAIIRGDGDEITPGPVTVTIVG